MRHHRHSGPPPQASCEGTKVVQDAEHFQTFLSRSGRASHHSTNSFMSDREVKYWRLLLRLYFLKGQNCQSDFLLVSRAGFVSG